MIQIIALCFSLVIIASCSGEIQPSLLHIHSSTNEAGEFWIRINNGESHRLLHDAQGYRPMVSPDGEWLAVEVRLMSDLEVVRLFQRKGNHFVAADKDVTAVAWRKAAAADNYELEALGLTKTRVSGWGNKGTTLWLELSGLRPGKQGHTETVVAIPLDHKQ